MTNDISSKFKTYFEYYNFKSNKTVLICDSPKVYKTTEQVLENNKFISKSKIYNYIGKFVFMKALVGKDYELSRVLRTDELLI